MRVVFIGASHWHTRHYFAPAHEKAGVEIVGVADPIGAGADKWAERAGCKTWTDYREMCARLRPDFAFALGRHCDMAGIARFLIDERIPFAMEKPCGISAAEVVDIAQRARQAGVFAAVGLVMRNSPLIDMIREATGGEKVRYATLKMVGRLAERYREYGHVEWMLDRRLAGGGAMLNLGVHIVDLGCTLLKPETPQVTAATMSNALNGFSIEDYGMISLKAGDSVCQVETGYLFPSDTIGYDMRYSIRTDGHYVIAHDENTIEILDDSMRSETRQVLTTNRGCYPIFTKDVLRRVEAGEPPLAGLDDMAAIMALVDAAYAQSPLSA